MKKVISSIALIFGFVVMQPDCRANQYLCPDDGKYYTTADACDAACEADCSDIGSTGQSIGKEVFDKWGSGEGLKKLTEGLLTSTTPLSTLDETKSGVTQISCPGAKEFLEIMVQPNATNDLQLITAVIDSDMDGTFDGGLPGGIFTAAEPISGTCANGVVSCDPGTWVNCRWYQWTYDKDTGIMHANTVGPKDLKGCYCFNSSCSPLSFVESKDFILQTIGMGMASAIVKQDTRITITKGEIDETAIKYYGSDMRDCTGILEGDINGIPIDLGDFGSETPENVFKSAVTLEELTTSEVATQEANPSSLMTLIENSQAVVSADVEECTIEENATSVVTAMSDVLSKLEGVDFVGETVTPEGEPALNIILGQLGDNYWCTTACELKTWDLTLKVDQPEHIDRVYIDSATFDDWIQLQLDGEVAWNGPYGTWTDPVALPPGACELFTNWMVYPNYDITEYFMDEGELDVHIRVAVKGCGEGYISIMVVLKELEQVVESETNGCSGLEEQEQCELQQEITYDAAENGVATILGYMPTGAVPVETCKAVGSETICKPWWKKERRYICDGSLKPKLDRVAEIENSIGVNATGYTYTDKTQSAVYNPETGEMNYTDLGSQDVSLNFTHEENEGCQHTCKLLRKNSLSQSGDGITTTDVRVDSSSGVVIYKTCQDDVCPADDGETILTDCSCISDFSQATSIMELMWTSGKDIICSDGDQKLIR